MVQAEEAAGQTGKDAEAGGEEMVLPSSALQGTLSLLLAFTVFWSFLVGTWLVMTLRTCLQMALRKEQ